MLNGEPYQAPAIRVLVTFAVEAEFAPWRKIRRFSKLTYSTGHANRAEWSRARIGQVRLDVYLTGISLKGPEQGLYFSEGQDLCISSGLAGALSPFLKISDVVVGKEIVPLEGQGAQESDSWLVEMAEKLGARTVQRFVNSKQILDTRESKLRAAQLGQAVEMESLSILKQARQKNIPCAAIRCISDAHDEELPLDFNRATNKWGEISFANVLAQIAKRPSQIPKVIEFGKRSKEAATRLTEFLDKYICEIDGLCEAGKLGRKKEVLAR